MQDMSFFDKNKLLFLRRKHKLFKSLAQQPPLLDPDADAAMNDISRLYEMTLNKENQASQMDYFIKHQLKSDLTLYTPSIMEILWNLLNIRSGSLLSFIAYRICRKHPNSYWTIINYVLEKLHCSDSKTLEQVIFLTDLYLYGFSFTIDEFITHLFPSFRAHILDLLPKYSDFFPVKHQKAFIESFQLWMLEERQQVETMHANLLLRSKIIQQNLIKEIENESQELSYIRSLEKYETQLYRFSNAMHFLKQQFSQEAYRLKSIFQLKKQCETFKFSFQYSEYERSLYLNSQALTQLKPLKKSQMLRIEQNEAYITRVKLCSNIKDCIDLSGYFLEQMNTQHNREELIEIIINDCYNYNNISYVLKVVLQISGFEPSLFQYCCTKGRKICGQSKMNTKYQKLLCEMCRFGLMDQNILLDYCEKILRLENNQVTKEIQSILENLGTMIYYRSLHTHTRINSLFERIEAMIKSKLVHFNIQHLFHLKGLLNYLRNHSNKISIADTEDMAELEIKTNFQFIFKKMEKLLKENQIKKILDFVSAGIDHQDFLSTYYYASLIKDLNQKSVNSQLHELTLKNINTSLEYLDAQRSICWSRFLGQLYNYEIINRKKLIDNLTSLLQRYQNPLNLGSCLKCICATLQTSKYYLKESQINRDKKEVIMLLLEIKKKVVCLNSIEQLLYDEISEIAQYFHSYLTHFDTMERIYDLIVLDEHSQQRYSIYTLLDMLQSGADVEELKNQQKNEAKKRYQEKQKCQEKKWVEKPIKYKEKEHESTPRNEIKQLRESPSKQSNRTEETREGRAQKKQIKVMGRSKGDKRIKIVTASYTETVE